MKSLIGKITRRFARFAGNQFGGQMSEECLHLDYRWLDCEDCRAKNKVCPILVCMECGTGVNEYDIDPSLEKRTRR